MGNMSTHDEFEVPDPGTPACRDVSTLDPRSPTLEIPRTPLEIVTTQRSRLKRLVSLLDPRSPSQHVSRTPLNLPRETARPEKPAVLAEEALFGLIDETDLGELDVKSAGDVVEGVAEPENAFFEVVEKFSPSINLKVARAVFFEDLAVASAVAKETVEEFTDAVESTDTAMLCVEEEPEKINEKSAIAEQAHEASVLAIENSEKNAGAEAVCETSTPAAVEKKNKCLPDNDLSTPTAVPRRLGKENALKKQLFLTPDKARLRTPLSNVSSFHNSPLRRN